jgi:CubicO group peptidase (beta-lactamase class C family)
VTRERFFQFRRHYRVSACVLCLFGGRRYTKSAEILFEKGWGLASLDYGVPITPSTIFHVASVSKRFTAFAITLLAQQGKLSVDDELRKHLPEIHDFGKPITLRRSKSQPATVGRDDA